jgi:rubrerythrin
MASFGPSDLQRATEEQAKQVQNFQDSQFSPDVLHDMSRDDLVRALEAEKQRADKLAQEVKELKEDKVKLSLILEEEDERRANLFLRKVEELEASNVCPKCAIMKTSANSGHLVLPVSRSASSMSVVEEKEEDHQNKHS